MKVSRRTLKARLSPAYRAKELGGWAAAAHQILVQRCSKRRNPLKPGGQTAATDAPGRKGRFQSVKIQYKILGDKPTATVKILGFD